MLGALSEAANNTRRDFARRWAVTLIQRRQSRRASERANERTTALAFAK